MAPPPLRAILLKHNTYPYEQNVPTADDDECLICRQSYTSLGQPGCHAIRLTHCGHVIGDSCFQQWIARHPNICPYYNHRLPTLPNNQFAQKDGEENGRGDWKIMALTRICNTAWFKVLDDYVVQVLTCPPLEGHNQTAQAAAALQALYEERLTLSAAAHTRREYMFAILMTCVIVESVPASFFLLAKALYLLGLIGSTNWLYTGSWHTAVISGCVLSLNAIGFLVVVEGVLRLGLRRSKMQQMKSGSHERAE